MECLELEVDAFILGRKSCREAFAWARSVPCSMHALPRVCSEAANPSSHIEMAPFLLSSNLSRVRSCSYSSTATADITATLGGGEGLHQPTSDDQRHDKKHAQAIADVE
jgi:hypothetical protein